MATPKHLRAVPSASFDSYILTREISATAGLTHLNDDLFTTFQPDPSFGGSINRGFSDDDLSELRPIGFDFLFDGTTYRRFIACSNGFLILCDPSSDVLATIASHVLLSGTTGTPSNENVRLTNTSKSVLIAPWWDDLVTLAETPEQIAMTAAQKLKLRAGIDPPDIRLNPTRWGVKYFYDEGRNAGLGRRTIIRWHAQSNFGAASSVVSFETVLYENGTIEFRYAPKKKLGSVSAGAGEDATIGIFASGSNRFRDFSYGLGYKDFQRTQYRYGGAIFNSSFTDTIDGTSRPYVGNLTVFNNWPGLDEFGAIFRFAPPTNRQQILPRVFLKNLDSQQSYPKEKHIKSKAKFNDSVFDDRRSINFVSGVVVNYPTTLHRFFGDTAPGTAQRQNLFRYDFEITASIVKSAVEQHIKPYEEAVADPFVEYSLFEQGKFNDPFFVSGSSSDFNETLMAGLQSKVQIKFSLPIDLSITPLSASIYYYNTQNKMWLLPRNSTGSLKGDVALPDSFASNQRVLEDHRGFGPIGNVLASGTNTPSGIGGTDFYINSSYNQVSCVEATGRFYAKTITNNSDYSATVDETFNAPIVYPFLLEKAVIELPLAASGGWFNDKTQSFMPLASTMGAFDFAGPACTLALMHQVQAGGQTRRNIIMTGTITHSNDVTSEIVLSNFPSLSSEFQMRPRGFLAYANPPAAVVYPIGTLVDTRFTGSVAVKMESLISNGVTLRVSKDMNFQLASPLQLQFNDNRLEALTLIGMKTITLTSSSASRSLGYNIAYVNPFGRGNTGFEPSGRSVYGREYCTSQGTVIKNQIRNPFYLTGSAYTTMSASIQKVNVLRAVAALSLESHFRSPYLLKPGDKLVLAFAKSRPFYYSTGLGGPTYSGSLFHDFQLITGSINITLYGSLLQQDRVTYEGASHGI